VISPDAPDELPILDSNPWDNLTLSAGRDRNRSLLAPVTAIIADLIQPQASDLLLAHFHDLRFADSGAFHHQSD
jgi:hypothetical protein